MVDKIIYGNCIDVLKLINDSSVSLIYIDPPYGTKRNLDFYDGYSLISLIEILKKMLIECKRVMKDDANIYLHGDYRFIHYIKIELDAIFGISNFVNEIIWYYNSGPRGKKKFGKRHDTILRYSKSNRFFFNEDSVRVAYSKTAPRGYTKEKYYNDKGKVMDDVWTINMLGQNDKTERINYSTQKPLDLMDIIIKSSSKENDLVLDPMCGSGSFLVSAKIHNRQYIGIDNNKKAIDIATSRLSKINVKGKDGLTYSIL